MKFLQNPILRALAAVVVGILLLKFSDAVLHGLAIAFGIMFLAVGIISLLGWVNDRRKKVDYRIYDAEGRELRDSHPMFPIAGLGSLILGTMMTVSSTLFLMWMMCLLSAVLVLGGLNECMNLWSARKYAEVHPALWCAPAVIIVAGVFVICNGLEPPRVTFIVLGVAALVFAAIETALLVMFYKKKKAWDEAQQRQAPHAIEAADAVVLDT